MLRDMLTPLAYIGKGFRKSCGIRFVYFTTDTHPNIRVVSLLRSESLDAVILSLFLNILSSSGNLLR
jgi:mevalonate pyrophosphate decarboxylase